MTSASRSGGGRPEGLLLTVGSSRQAKTLQTLYQDAGWTTEHVDDSDVGTQLTDVVCARVMRHADVRVASFARASSAGSVRRVAGALDAVRLEYDGDAVRCFGPSAQAASACEDKWRTHLALAAAGVPVVPTRIFSIAELRASSSKRRVVAKVRTGTGGAGIVGGYLGPGLATALGALAPRVETEGAVVADFVQGHEASFKVLAWRGRAWPVATVLKEETVIPVVHGDWKIKLARPMRPGSPNHVLAASAACALGVTGFFSVEGIVAAGGKFLASEVAARRTGSHDICDAVSTSGRSAVAIREILETDKCSVGEPGVRELAAVTLPFVADSPESVLRRLDGLGRFVIGVDSEDLAQLPGSDDARKRVRVHFYGPLAEIVATATSASITSGQLAERLRALVQADGRVAG